MSDVATRANYDLRDEIKAYWSERAATFDLSPGHEIFSEEERAAWHRLILRHLGEGAGRAALDLASGTGVVSHLLDDLGFRVTGIDWAEPMLDRARQKAKTRGRNISFRMGDAENTMEPDDHYHVVVNRHLVWTLVDPSAAFSEWLRVLKPGGSLLIVDGDFVNATRLERFFSSLNAWGQRVGLLRPDAPSQPREMLETHRSILARVHFSQGARAEAVVDLLHASGFTDIRVDTDLGEIHRMQAKNWNLFKGLARRSQHRFAIHASKPAA
ncbi:class I SAM-dependent methyltransferase [Sinorhizobium medicae]|uniref:Methyltransferase type 11 n=1 Tax=Sinorhizobium medicae TaxID=110321 RepID=A0A508X849_9HYPH|nr:class I SAM-dependent methyltransferase [Sinorhizobium medicae]MDX0409280.1 methyltransferase domain-containing protein [Sinorhizobium medicae]MDX0446228.1 methyltransferase domain-containing protein [Sinorhizobium medicae]MDX0470380.1 methyltransferase domain-containing protein [Sinorhizobium medicae]MDX0520442.1 methyltransferase domain-containing protein [Sinorhizobium medicae]MDX0544914.1 methyltransferase domain-containing protein [Sinorhizobium medicae]